MYVRVGVIRSVLTRSLLRRIYKSSFENRSTGVVECFCDLSLVNPYLSPPAASPWRFRTSEEPPPVALPPPPSSPPRSAPCTTGCARHNASLRHNPFQQICKYDMVVVIQYPRQAQQSHFSPSPSLRHVSDNSLVAVDHHEPQSQPLSKCCLHRQTPDRLVLVRYSSSA